MHTLPSCIYILLWISQGNSLFGPYIYWTKIPSPTKILGATVCKVYLAPKKHFLVFLSAAHFFKLVIRSLLDILPLLSILFGFYLCFSLGSSDGIVVGFSEAFVIILFLNFWCMCPFTVCFDLGRYLLTRSTVRPGKVSKKFCFITSIHVEIGGLKHAWWRKIARFYFDKHAYTEFSEICSIIGDGFIFFLSFHFLLYPT